MDVKLSRSYRDKDDNVSYISINKDGARRDNPRVACFGSIIHHLGAHEIICRPWDNRNSAPSLAFHRFFRLLKRHGLVPRGVTVHKSTKNSITIPRRGWGYHPVFVALSLYRHADVHGASLLGQTMRLHDTLRKDGTHFLQCLHWALAHTNHGNWHSCFTLSNSPAYPYGNGTGENRNLKHGIAIAAYGQLGLKKKNELGSMSSTAMFNVLAGNFRDIEVEDVDDVLDPKYAKFYENPDLARK